jgi:hypothetical protein
MATVIAPFASNTRRPDKGRFAHTHIANPAYVVESLRRLYVHQYSTDAHRFIARIEVRRGNAKPADPDITQVRRGYDA